MAAEITPFQFPATGQSVRTVMADGQPWFVAVDVCAVLGIGDTRQAANSLDEDERCTTPVIDSLGREQQTYAINEPGLYSLVLRSRKTAAKAFKRWITHEVLPAIRETGSYSVAPAAPALPQDYEEALEALLEKVRDNKALTVENAKLRVKAEAFDLWLNGKGCYLVGTVAKMLNVGPKALWDFLYAEKLIIKAPGTRRHREPYARPDTKGWFEVEPVPPDRANGHATKTTGVTPYGAEQIRLRLIKRGILPSQQLALIGGSA